MKETLKGAMLVLLAMTIFASFGVFVRFLALPSHVLVFFNFLFTSILLYVFFFFKDRSVLKIKGQGKMLGILAVFNTLNNFFFFQAFKFTTISAAVLTHYTAPIFVALLAPIILKEKIEKITVKALIIAFVGLLIITLGAEISLQNKDFIGMLYGTASGLFYGLVIIYVKQLSSKISIFAINIYHSFMVALLLLPFVLVTEFVFDSGVFLKLLGFALLFGILATSLHMAGVKRIKSQHAGILAYIEPVAASVFGFLIFSEVPRIFTVVGGIFILFSGYLIIRRES